MNVERPIDPVAEAALPPTGDARGDIDDEIGDHLALAARDLQLAGHASEEARRLALAKFGDVDQIRRKCWWIQQGDAVMSRAALGLAIAVLILAVVGLAIGGWKMNSAINDLGDTLAAINETQKALLDRNAEPLLTPTPAQELTVNGRLSLGDKPARHADVYLFDLPNGKLLDHLYADEQGRFVSKPLPAGPYFVLAPLVGKENPIVDQGGGIGPFANKQTPLFAIQSEPISVYPWSKKRSVEIDVKMFPVGEVSFELNRPLPASIEVGEGDQKNSVQPTLFLAIPSKFKHEPLPATKSWQTEGEYAPVSWVIGHWAVAVTFMTDDLRWPRLGGGFVDRQDESKAITSIGPFLVTRWAGAGYQTPHVFPVGDYEIGVFIRAGFEPPGPTTKKIEKLETSTMAKFKVVDGARTHLRLTLPENLERSVQAALAEAGSDKDKLIAMNRTKYPVRVEVVGEEELAKTPEGTWAANGREMPTTWPASEIEIE